MMGADDLVNWVFAYMLIGAVIWMLMYSAGLIHKAWGTVSHAAVVFASIAAIIGWPVIVFAFFAGVWSGRRMR
ncbi:hypothetical protein ACKWRH_21415 [Bradyrhizobium sp. Pa8]|uniref:hypothetical protein n=1 Tax=Bradyrhizobium sp. Pa8 TaxID=3386552 RepID=UPI00403F65BE